MFFFGFFQYIGGRKRIQTYVIQKPFCQNVTKRSDLRYPKIHMSMEQALKLVTRPESWLPFPQSIELSLKLVKPQVKPKIIL